MVDRWCWADGQLRALLLYGRSCVRSGSVPATKSRIFPLRLVLLSSAVRRRKDPDEQLAFHYEIQHWGRAGPSATGADLSLFLSRTGSSCWGGNVTSQLHGAAAEAAVFFRWRCNAGREAGRVNQTWKRELQCWKLSSVGLIPAAAPWIHHLFLCCWRSTEWLRVQRFTNSELSASGEIRKAHLLLVRVTACCAQSLRISTRFTMVAESPVEILMHSHPDVMDKPGLSRLSLLPQRVAGLVLQAGQKTSSHVEQTRPGFMRPMMSQCPGLTLAFTRVSETTILGTSSLCDIISSKSEKTVCSLSVALLWFMWHNEQMFVCLVKFDPVIGAERPIGWGLSQQHGGCCSFFVSS